MLIYFQIWIAILAIIIGGLIYIFLSINRKKNNLIHQYQQTFKSFRELNNKSSANFSRNSVVYGLLQIPDMLCNQTNSDAAMLFFSNGEDENILNQLGNSESFNLPGYNHGSKTIDLRSTEFASILKENKPIATRLNNTKRKFEEDKLNPGKNAFEYLLIVPIHSDNTLRSVIIIARLSKQFSKEELLSVEALSSFYSYLVLSKISLLDQYERYISKGKSQQAAEIQMRLIENRYLELEYASICTYTVPAENIHSDFHDLFLDTKLQVISAYALDIAGRNVHHVSQAMIMLRSLFQVMLRSRQEPQKIMKIINGFLTREQGVENYAQVSLLQYSKNTRTVYFTSAGITMFLIFRLNTQEVEVVGTSDIVLGVDDKYRYTTREYLASSGDIFLTCTDGILEVMDEAGEFYGKDRLIKIIKDNYYHSPEDIKDKLFQELSLFRGRAKKYDDKTVVILKIY